MFSCEDFLYLLGFAQSPEREPLSSPESHRVETWLRLGCWGHLDVIRPLSLLRAQQVRPVFQGHSRDLTCLIWHFPEMESPVFSLTDG